MKYIKLIIVCLLVFGCKENNISKKLIIIEQDYNKALKLAAQEEKLLFIDFYTTWWYPL